MSKNPCVKPQPKFKTWKNNVKFYLENPKSIFFKPVMKTCLILKNGKF